MANSSCTIIKKPFKFEVSKPVPTNVSSGIQTLRQIAATYEKKKE
jgi:hypothetical protein